MIHPQHIFAFSGYDAMASMSILCEQAGPDFG